MKTPTTPYEKGKALEKSIALQLRRKGFKAYRDKRSGAGEVYKSDIAAPGFNFHTEAKAQKTIKLMEWWNQTTWNTPLYKKPLLVVEADSGEQLAVLTLNDFLDLMKTLEVDSAALTALRSIE